MINQNKKTLLEDLNARNIKFSFKLNDEFKDFQTGIEISYNDYKSKLNSNFNQLEKYELDSFYEDLNQTKTELHSKIEF